MIGRLYREIFREFRDWYFRKEGANSDSTFTAAMLMALLGTVNVMSIVSIVDLGLNRVLTAVPYMMRHRLIVVGLLVVIGAVHLALGRRLRDSPVQRSDSPLGSRAKNYLRVSIVIFCMASAALVVAKNFGRVH